MGKGIQVLVFKVCVCIHIAEVVDQLCDVPLDIFCLRSNPLDLGEFGQPFLRLLRDVAAGEEITADYGPWYAYQRHGFNRHRPDPELHTLT
jgi:hypothetical protein